MPRFPGSIKQPRQLFSQPRGTLRAIFNRATLLLAIQQQVRKVIPGDIEVASLSDGTLHLVTPSAALASRLRYSQRSLLGGLKTAASTEQIRTIKVSVRPKPVEKPRFSPTPAVPPNARNARQIADTAKYIEDEPLRKALMRLADRGKPAS